MVNANSARRAAKSSISASPGTHTASRADGSNVGGAHPSMSHCPSSIPEKPRRYPMSPSRSATTSTPNILPFPGSSRRHADTSGDCSSLRTSAAARCARGCTALRSNGVGKRAGRSVADGAGENGIIGGAGTSRNVAERGVRVQSALDGRIERLMDCLAVVPQRHDDEGSLPRKAANPKHEHSTTRSS